MVVAAAVGALAGCLHTELVECADDRLCPAGTACDVVHKSCVAPDQLTACADLPDLTSCVATGVELGRCFSGVCLPGGCGNGEVEPEELCDDGNTIADDGCSADCRSREVCGDGVTEPARGEQCDDGNTRGRDGCTNGCTLERPTWHVRASDEPTPRIDAAAAFDPLYGTIVMFGGQDKDQGLHDDTWGLDAGGWSTLMTDAPQRRRGAAMTYDPDRHRAVMFGGLGTQSLLLDDTWEWSGAVWIRRTPAMAAPARTRAALAWDGTRTILFGGSQAGDLLADTWAWDGTTWTRLSPAHAPPARHGHAMVFDPKYSRVVLVGGFDPTATNDTWIFDGADWQKLASAASPPNLQWAALAYDTRRGVVVLSGVEAGTSSNVLWELDGQTWTDRNPDVTPSISGGAVLAYDRELERVVQYGGTPIAGGAPRGDIWEWDGDMWMLRPRAELPVARQLCSLASDPLRGRVVLFGGQGSTIPLGDTWEWDGTRWRESAAQSPPLRVGSAMAFDGREVVLFGGAGADIYGDTWHFDGTRWQKVASAGPPPRFGAAITYDTKRDRVWLFGGSDGSQQLADLWQWNGITWMPVPVTAGPSARSYAKLAYDVARDRVVLFGGLDTASAKLTDTWEWDGTQWAERTSAVRPEARRDFSLVYDRMRARTMLFGGVISGFSLWEWDGAAWTQPEPALVPAVQNAACAAYDDARGEIVTFGGMFGTLQQQTTTGAYRGDREELCASGLDLDGDAAIGCDDDDCARICAPVCWGDASCTKAPRCGDGTCSALEADAGACCTADCP